MHKYSAIILFSLATIGRCLGDGCTPPSDVSNGYFTPTQEVYEYNSNITYHCNEGYELMGRMTRTCSGYKHIAAYIWVGDDPQCKAIQCPVPDFENAVIQDAAEPADFSSRITYMCLDGYIPMGVQTAECMLDGTWQYSFCERPEYTCTQAPPRVAHATHNASAMSAYPPETVVVYKCDVGYNTEILGMQTCKKTSGSDQAAWVGSLPFCDIFTTTAKTGDDSENSTDNSTLFRIELPIISGVVTAVLLTAILILLVYCLRRRRIIQFTKKADSIASSSTATSTASPTDFTVTPTQSFRLPRSSVNSVSTHHSPPPSGVANSRPSTPISSSRVLSTPAPLIPCSIATPSMMDTTPSEVEFHTIRECLGDFRNNNHTLPRTSVSTSCESPSFNPATYNNKTSAYPYHQTFLLDRASLASTPRPDWAPQACPHQHYTMSCRHYPTPYETVTCPHGVEHVYQPLEHVYEEPRIWMQPLPNPHQHNIV